MKTIVLCLAVMFLPRVTELQAQSNIRIGLFNTSAVQTFTFSPVSSCYLLSIDSIFTDSVQAGEILYTSLQGEFISVRSINGELGKGHELRLEACDSSAFFNLRPAFPAMAGRLFDDNLILRADLNRILAINEVDFELYIAGVIESEGGTRAPLEYYKAQAVLCRTYALQNIDKHGSEGFNLCNGVHCQAYLSRSDHNADIYRSVLSTRGEVALYADSVLITAAFHSNCGGESQNSENEWVSAAPYLRSVQDPWCRESRNARWQKTIKLDEWRKYAFDNGIKAAQTLAPEDFRFLQHKRRAFYLAGADSIPLKKIRSDWMLKSGFFSVSYISPDKLVFDGRGYGHGIGLCQEGAMTMARKGFTYRDILLFYYTNITIREKL